MERMDQKYIIEHSLLSAVVAYLVTKPYREVAELIAALQRVEPIKERVEE